MSSSSSIIIIIMCVVSSFSVCFPRVVYVLTCSLAERERVERSPMTKEKSFRVGKPFRVYKNPKTEYRGKKVASRYISSSIRLCVCVFLC